ncbi:MAG: phage portal protein [Chloroflexota bacterium]|nr:phage portal protein [Chloroflexota bacterium]
MKTVKDNLRNMLGPWARRGGRSDGAHGETARRNPSGNLVQRRNRAGNADLDPMTETFGRGAGWANPEYGNYYASSVSVYAAIKLRADAVSRPAVHLYRTTSDGSRQLVGPEHPARQLLDRVNPWYTQGDLWQATEIYLNLWGQAFWALERDENGRREIWPLRPDRVSVLPDRRNYIRGFVYRGQGGTPVAYAADEVVWLRYFNPMEEFAGLSPLAPARLSVDMGRDGLRFNRNFLRNSAQPDFVLLTDSQLTDREVEEFYNRWDARFQGPHNAHRPAIANFVKDIHTLGLSHRDMDFIRGLRWSLEEVSRAYGVPKPLLADLERATFANINAAERIFWRNTIAPEIHFLEEHLNRMLMPRLGFPDIYLEFDLTSIEAMREDENSRVARQVQLLDRGALTINEVRREQKLPDVPWGDRPLGRRGAPSADISADPEGGDMRSSAFDCAEAAGLPGVVRKEFGRESTLGMQ